MKKNSVLILAFAAASAAVVVVADGASSEHFNEKIILPDLLEDATFGIEEKSILTGDTTFTANLGPIGRNAVASELLEKINKEFRKMDKERKERILNKAKAKSNTGEVDADDLITAAFEDEEFHSNVVDDTVSTFKQDQEPIYEARSLAAQSLSTQTLNAYFAGTTYGRDPGPCEDFNRRCKGLACNLQGYIKDLVVVGNSRLGDIIVTEASPCTESRPDLLYGLGETWELTCRDISIASITLSSTVAGDKKSVDVLFGIGNLRLACSGFISIKNAGLKALKTRPPNSGFRDPDGLCVLNLLRVRNPIAAENIRFEFDSTNKNGISLRTKTTWKVRPGQTFDTDVPIELDFTELPDSGTDNGCRFDQFDFNFRLFSIVLRAEAAPGFLFGCTKSFGLMTIDLSGGLASFFLPLITNFVVGIISGLLAGIICNIIRQFAFINGNQATPGGFNLAIKELARNWDRYRAQGLRGRPQYEADERRLIPGKNLRSPPHVSFATSKLFEAASSGLNRILGGCSTNDRYSSSPCYLVINEVVDVATGNLEGRYDTGDLKDKFELADYPHFEWKNNPIFDGRVNLKSFGLRNVNSMTKLSILDNGFANPGTFGPKYTYTTINNFEIENFGMVATLNVILNDGDWVTNRGGPRQPAERTLEFDINLNLALRKIKALVVPFIAWNPDIFFPIQIGQIFGPVAKNVDRLRCFFTTVGWFEMTGLQASLGTPQVRGIADIGVDFAGNGNLEPLIAAGVNIFNSMYRAALSIYLPFIAENYVRRVINDNFAEIFKPENRRCLPVVIKPFRNDSDYVNFQSSNGFELVETLLNDVIGGNPIKKSDADVNAIIDSYLQYYLPKIDPDDLELKHIAYGNYSLISFQGNKPININLPERRLSFSNWRLVNVNSIHDIRISDVAGNTPAARQSFFLRAVIGDGNVLVQGLGQIPDRNEYRGRIGASFDFDSFISVKSRANPNVPEILADDAFSTFFGLGNLTISIQMQAKLNTSDALFLRFEDLLSPSCLLAVLDFKKVDLLELEFLSFLLDFQTKKPPSDTKLGRAIAGIQTVNSQNGFQINLKKNLNYFFTGVARVAAKEIDEFPVNLPVVGCATRETPFNSNLLVRIGKALFAVTNISDIYNKFASGPVTPKPQPIGRKDGKVLLCDGRPAGDFSCFEDINTIDVRDGDLVKLVREKVNDVTSVKSFLKEIANVNWKDITKGFDFQNIFGTKLGNRLEMLVLVLDALVVEKKGLDDVINLRMPLADLGFPDIDDDFFAPDLKIQGGLLSIVNLDQFQDFELLKPYGTDKFTLDHVIRYAQPLKFQLSVNISVDDFWSDRTKTVFTTSSTSTKTVYQYEFQFEQLSIEARTITALNLTRMFEIELGHYFEQSSRDCLGSIFFRDGLEIEMLWVETNIPDTVIRRFTVPANKPEFFNSAYVDFFDAILDILLRILADDVPRATHSGIRVDLNKRAKQWIDDSLVKFDCGPTKSFFPPYFDFLNSITVRDAMEAFNKNIGGNPVRSGLIGFNQLVDLGLKLALDNDLIPLESLVRNSPGSWDLPELLKFIPSTGNIFTIDQIQLRNLDTVNIFTLTPLDTRSFGIDFRVGAGTLFNTTNNATINKGDLTLSINTRMKFRSSRTNELFADETFKVTFALNGSRINLEPFVLLDMNKLYQLQLRAVSSPQCLLSTLDDIQLPRFDIDQGSFGVNITGTFVSTRLLSDAFRHLQLETPDKYLTSRPAQVLKNILKGVTTVSKDLAASYDNSLFPTKDCIVPRVLLSINSGINTQEHANALIAAMRAIPGVIQHSVRVDFKNNRFRTLVVQSNELKTNRNAFIQKVVETAKSVRRFEKPPVVVQLTERGPCAGTPLGGTIFETSCSFLVLNGGNITKLIEEASSPQINLVDRRVSASDIEGQVKLSKNDTFYNIQTSAFVSAVSSYFENNGLNKIKDILKKFADDKRFFEFLNPGNVTSRDLKLNVNITELMGLIDDTFLTSNGSCTDGQGAPSFLLRSLLEETNTFVPRMRIRPQNLTIENIEDLGKISLLKPYPGAKFTTSHTISYVGKKPLKVKIGIEIDFDKSFNDNTKILGQELATEKMEINVELRDMFLQILTMLAIDTKRLGQVSLGDFFDVDKAFHEIWNNTNGKVDDPEGLVGQGTQKISRNCFAIPCLIGAIYDQGLFLPQVWLNFSNIIGPTFTSINNQMFSPGVEKLINATMVIGTQLSIADIPNFIQGSVRNEINKVLVGVVSDAKDEGACPKRFNYTRDYPKEISTFGIASSENLRNLNNFINETLFDPNSTFNINVLLRNFVGDFKTDLIVDIKEFPLEYRGSKYGTFNFKLGEFGFAGLDQIDTLRIFDAGPIVYEYGTPNVTIGRRLANREWTPSELQFMSRTQFGHGQFTNMTGAKGVFSLSMRIAYEFKGLFESDFVKNDMRFTIKLNNTDMILDMFTLINIPRLLDLQVQSIASLGQIPCILAIFEPQGLAPAKFSLTFGGVGFEAECLSECNSPFFQDLFSKGAVDSDTSAALSNTFTRSFNSIVEFLITFMASTDTQDTIDKRIETAQEDCKAIQLNVGLPDVGEVETSDVASLMGIAGLGAVFLTACAFACLVPVHSRRRNEHLKMVLIQAGMNGQSSKSKDEFDLAERKLQSAFRHPAIPRRIKFLIPVMLLTNIIFLITANFFANGAVVEIRIAFAGSQSNPLSLLEFTLESSINDMWAAGVYPLALIIALASGAWPYAKNIIMAYCWFSPATLMSAKKRQHVLEILEVFGKLSLIDIYVLIMLQVAFRFYITSTAVQQLSLLPPDFLVIDVIVAPEWGIFGFTFAVIGSILAGTIMLWYNQKAIDSDENLEDAIRGVLVRDIATPRIALWNHKFAVTDAKGNSYRYAVSWRLPVACLLALSLLLIVIGSAVELMTFTFKGLAGLAIAFVDRDLASNTYSLLTIGTDLINGTTDEAISKFSVILLQIMYLLFAFVVPLVAISMLIVLFTVPLTLKEQTLLRFATSAVFAWEALIVFCISVIAAIFQISQLAQFIVQSATGNLCTALEAPLREIFPNDETNAKCFNVTAEIVLPTGVIIFIAAFIQLVSSMVAWRLVDAALRDRTLTMKRKIPVSPGEMTGLEGFLVRRALEPFATSSKPVNAKTNTTLQAAPPRVQNTTASMSQLAPPAPLRQTLPSATPSVKAAQHYSIDV